MVEIWLKFFLESPWSASIVILVGAVIGGAASVFASWFVTKKSLDAQFSLQQKEWQRRDAERLQEKKDREERDREEQAQRDKNAVCAIAIEALFNCMNLLGFAKIAFTPREPNLIFREKYDRHIESLLRVENGGSVQLLTNLYASARAFELSIAEKSGGMGVDQRAVNRARDLSHRFEVMFRTFGQRTLSSSDMETLEQTLNVAKVELGG